ncbi:MAG: EamA family transporter [Cyanobacteria bacterium P01_D01_bin.1]
MPPHFWFVISAIFRYLGPAFAVLLFDQIDALGVAWFRITSAAIIFALWARPWQTFHTAFRRTNRQKMMLLSLGACLAIMNSAFYLAIERLPLSLVATMEFVGAIAIALLGLKTIRNYMALGIAAAGVMALIDVRWSSDLLGLSFAAANALLFVTYVVLSHRISQQGLNEGVSQLGAAMAVAFVFIMPIGVQPAASAFASPTLIFAGIGVGVCSSVVPYVCDQLAMAQLTRSAYALALALLPAIATLIGVIVLRQIPTLTDICGVALVMLGVILHQPRGSRGL